jgi:hypothetical protein
MENIDGLAYKKAKDKVTEIKGFYYNVICYCVAIPFLIFVNLKTLPEFHWFWFSACGWGTALIFHGLSAFGYIPFLNKDWEDRKLQELMQKDKFSGDDAVK